MKHYAKTLILAGAALPLTLAGCAQITVTSDTLVEGTARIADATTNAVEGTSNFTTNTTRRADAQTHAARLAYVRSQMVQLRREAAAGQGEHLRALAYMMQSDDEAAFAQRLQQNYAAIFPTNDRSEKAATMLRHLYSVVGTPPDMQRG